MLFAAQLPVLFTAFEVNLDTSDMSIDRKIRLSTEIDLSFYPNKEHALRNLLECSPLKKRDLQD